MAVEADPRGGLPWWRLWSVQASFEPGGQQWLGWLVCMAPWLRRRLDAAERAHWIEQEPSTLNTNPYLFGLLVGVRQSVEERHGPQMGRRVTQALQSALGALGDALTWTALRPLAALVAALAGWWVGTAGVLVAWIGFAIGQAWLRQGAYLWGRRRGLEAVDGLEGLGLRRYAETGRRSAGLLGGVLAGLVLVATISGATAGSSAPSVGPVPVVLLVVASASLGAWRRWRGESTLLVAVAVLWLFVRTVASAS